MSYDFITSGNTTNGGSFETTPVLLISKCCRAPAWFEGIDGSSTAPFYVCSKCGNVCDAEYAPARRVGYYSPEVEFNADERALLDLLHGRMANDGSVRVNDTDLIQALGIPSEEVGQRFFAAKMRLVTAGVISLFVNGNAGSLIRLNMPERAKQRSRRYVFMVVPLELANDVTDLIRNDRQSAKAREKRRNYVQKRDERRISEAEDALLSTREVPVPDAKPATAQRGSGEYRFALAQSKLGVHPAGPIRPPLAKDAGQP